jgi:oxalate decarboxylase
MKTGESMPNELSRRKFIGAGSAAVAVVAGLQAASAEEQVPRSQDHHLPNESEPGPNNTVLDKQNPDSVWAPETDAGGQPPFKYPFALAHKRIEAWRLDAPGDGARFAHVEEDGRRRDAPDRGRNP